MEDAKDYYAIQINSNLDEICKNLQIPKPI